MADRFYKENFNFDFNIWHGISTGYEMDNLHCHDVYEIYYCMTDGVKFFVNDRFYNVNIGNILIFNNLDLHRSLIPKNLMYDRYVIVFKAEFIEDLSTSDTDLLKYFHDRPHGFCHLALPEEATGNEMLALMKKAVRMYNSNSYGKDVYQKTILAEILIIINNIYNAQNSFSSQSSGRAYKRITPVLEYINKHIEQPFSLEELAEKFYISKNYLCYLFKSATGFTINEYIISRRLLKAKALLKQGYSVTDTCSMAGFNNLSHFIRTFKEGVGVPPKKYSQKA